MRNVIWIICLSLLTAGMLPFIASASTDNIGFVAFDVTNPPLAEVDIDNQTAANASTFPDTTFPVTNLVDFSSLKLVVNFKTRSRDIRIELLHGRWRRFV